jgi:hypothetical protein
MFRTIGDARPPPDVTRPWSRLLDVDQQDPKAFWVDASGRNCSSSYRASAAPKNTGWRFSEGLAAIRYVSLCH